MATTIPLTSCPGCAATASEPHLVGDHELRRCTTCGLVRAVEYADPDEVFVEGYLTPDSEYGQDISHPRFQTFLHEVQVRRLDILTERGFTPPGRFLDVGAGEG